jgi:hypothetical protein
MPRTTPAAKKTPPRKTAPARGGAKPRVKDPTPPPDAYGPLDPLLRRTDVDGVFRNTAGDLVNQHGVLLGFAGVKQQTAAAESLVLGKPAETPAEVLKFAALNPMFPLQVRLDAAKAAAPYYDRRRPFAVDGGEDPANPAGPGLPFGNLADLKGLSNAELATLHTLLSKASM